MYINCHVLICGLEFNISDVRNVLWLEMYITYILNTHKWSRRQYPKIKHINIPVTYKCSL